MPAKILGVDWGEARAGLALSDDLGLLAHPLETLHAKNGPLLEQLVRRVRTHAVSAVIIGLPRNMNGTCGPAAEKARAFAEALRSQIAPTPVHLWDERLTTAAAARSLRDSGKNSRKQKPLIDQVAAVLLLQSWLDAHPQPPFT